MPSRSQTDVWASVIPPTVVTGLTHERPLTPRPWVPAIAPALELAIFIGQNRSFRVSTWACLVDKGCHPIRMSVSTGTQWKS